MEKCGMILTPITSAAARSAATKSVMPEHYLQNMDTLGLQQLEHLEKELEQAKQKVTKFLQLKPQGIIDQTARRNQPSNSCDDHDSCEVVRKLNTNAHTVHIPWRRSKRKKTPKKQKNWNVLEFSSDWDLIHSSGLYVVKLWLLHCIFAGKKLHSRPKIFVLCWWVMAGGVFFSFFSVADTCVESTRTSWNNLSR